MSAAVFLVCAFAADIYRNELEKILRRQTSNIAKLLIGQFDTSITSMDDMLLQIASEYSSIETNGPEKLEQFHELLKRNAPWKSYSNILISITDKTGMVVATNKQYPFTPFDVTNKDFFNVHANDPDNSILYISTPQFGRIIHKQVIFFSRPLRKKDGAFDGVVQVSYPVSDFLRLFERLDFRDVGLVGFVRRDGIFIVRSAKGILSYGRKLPANAIVFRRIQSGEKEGFFDAIAATDQKRRIGYFIVSEVAPFHAYVGYDYSYIASAYEEAVVVLGAIWALLTALLFGTVLFGQKTEALRQQARIVALESGFAERKRILSDMHDSIGASLAVLISHLKPGADDWINIKQKATQTLIELRLLVDSVGGQDADVNAVLSSVRHRMQSGLEIAGIKVIWNVGQLPKNISLMPPDAWALRLILMEALSNVMHHGHANTATLSAIYDKAAHFVMVTVTDDGCGFDTATSTEGAGLTNMQLRAKKLTWHTTIHIGSKLGKGTTVRIKIGLPADVVITD
jgi:signal transduction histidine kinase